jgi:hypothetical protein
MCPLGARRLSAGDCPRSATHCQRMWSTHTLGRVPLARPDGNATMATSYPQQNTKRVHLPHTRICRQPVRAGTWAYAYALTHTGTYFWIAAPANIPTPLFREICYSGLLPLINALLVCCEGCAVRGVL